MGHSAAADEEVLGEDEDGGEDPCKPLAGLLGILCRPIEMIHFRIP